MAGDSKAEIVYDLILQLIIMINGLEQLSDHLKLLCRSVIVLGKDINVAENKVDWFTVPLDARMTPAEFFQRHHVEKSEILSQLRNHGMIDFYWSYPNGDCILETRLAFRRSPITWFKQNSEEQCVTQFLATDVAHKCLFYDNLYREEFEIEHLTKDQIVTKVEQKGGDITRCLKDRRYIAPTNKNRVEKLTSRLWNELA